jgi:hypothetical protein
MAAKKAKAIEGHLEVARVREMRDHSHIDFLSPAGA